MEKIEDQFDDDIQDIPPYIIPEEIAKDQAYAQLGVAGCPKCGKPLGRRMTAKGPAWVCGCPEKT